MQTQVNRSEVTDLLAQIANCVYHAHYDNALYTKATQGHSSVRANMLTEEALALCGSPYYGCTKTRWSAAEQAFLDAYQGFPRFGSLHNLWTFFAAPQHFSKESCYLTGVEGLSTWLYPDVVAAYRLGDCQEGRCDVVVHTIAQALYEAGRRYVWGSVESYVLGLANLEPLVAEAVLDYAEHERNESILWVLGATELYLTNWALENHLIGEVAAMPA